MTDTRGAASVDAGASSLRNVAHELRTPLTSVLGLFSLLEDQTLTIGDAETGELITMGRREAERMLFLVENLLTRARLAQDALEAATVPVDLREVFHEALDRFPEVARRTLLPLDRDAVVDADPRLALQIATNLIQNVDRYAPTGEVEIRFDRDGDVVHAHLADSGPGIAADDADAVFSRSSSDIGLGLGLAISRDLARLMGGDLHLKPEPLRTGATFTLSLPTSTRPVPAAERPAPDDRPSALPPSARILVDMTEVLANRDLDLLVAGVNRMLGDLLQARSGCVALRSKSGSLTEVGSFGATHPAEFAPSGTVHSVMETEQASFVRRLGDLEPVWAERLESTSALFAPVPGIDGAVGVIAVGWMGTEEPSPGAVEITKALGRLVGFGVERAHLAADADFERRLRFSVMEALPIAISVFAGDPPRAVDWNERERLLLGMDRDEQRPANLALSQEMFDVRFLDGTPLDLANSPVAQAIRTGVSSGPFFLRVRRIDGTETLTRTYCAPFFDEQGNVAAVVTSEEISEDEAHAEAAARTADRDPRTDPS